MRKWQKIQKIWFDILKVQNLLFPIVSSDFLYFHSFTSKNCQRPFLEKVIRFLERRNYSVFMIYHCFMSLSTWTVDIGKIWWNSYVRGDSEFSEYQIGFSVSHPTFSQIYVKLGQFHKVLMLARTKFGP